MHPPSHPFPFLLLTTLFLTATLLLPPSLAFPTIPIASNSYLASTWAPPPATCLPPSTPPPPYTLSPAWSAGMKSCLSELNNLGWNGVHCVPSNTTTVSTNQANPSPASASASATAQPTDPNSPFTPPPTPSSAPATANGDGGPTFGFYKGGDDGFKKLHLEGNDCFNACEACLEKGIESGGGVVKCRWVPAEGAGCWMGFEKGG